MSGILPSAADRVFLITFEEFTESCGFEESTWETTSTLTEAISEAHDCWIEKNDGQLECYITGYPSGRKVSCYKLLLIIDGAWDGLIEPPTEDRIAKERLWYDDKGRRSYGGL